MPTSKNTPFVSLVTTLALVLNFALSRPVAAQLRVVNYVASLSGDRAGSFSGVDQPLGGGNLHLLRLDTSSLGTGNEVLTVQSSSQAGASGLSQLPVSHTVVPVPEPSLGVMALGIGVLFATTRKPHRPRIECWRTMAK